MPTCYILLEDTMRSRKFVPILLILALLLAACSQAKSTTDTMMGKYKEMMDTPTPDAMVNDSQEMMDTPTPRWKILP
jgi:PBP1b-binding outer membrane lipoprotein LpoB